MPIQPWGMFLVLAAMPLCAFPAELRFNDEGKATRVEIVCDDQVLLSSPPEGLWSIATSWDNDWPNGWNHAQPERSEQAGEWTILHGELKTEQGVWKLSDAYRQEDELIRCTRRFVWTGEKPLVKQTLSVRFQTSGQGDGVLLPGILYYGNPSGAKSGRVPVYAGHNGDEAIFEEHRYPMPFASLEWQKNGRYLGVAMHSLPSPVPFANLHDQWWSMGVQAKGMGTEFLLLSGPCAGNGKRGVIKAVQPGFVPYHQAYLNIPPGAIIEKTFYLQAYPVTGEGRGFQQPVKTSLKLFSPYSLETLPTFSEIIQAKYRFAKTRWFEDGNEAGFNKYPFKNTFVIGWCGQAAAPGYALQALNEEFGDPNALTMAQKSLDFLSSAEFYEGGFHTWYDCEKKKWEKHEPLSQGQGMLSIARAIKMSAKTGLDSTKWKEFLKKACTFHADRILNDSWQPVSTDEAFFIAPLCEGADLFDDNHLREAAIKAGVAYAQRHLTMHEPYWGGTLDASCEDKEGAYAAMQGFLALHALTGDVKYLEWAEHACDVVLTYVVVWDIDLPPGRLRDHDFTTRGWTAVSPQNQHIDVYGVLIAPDIYRLGVLVGRDDLKRLALVMFRSCGQLIDPYGSQGEQPQHTNYAQRGEVDDVFALRGGYAEDWTVFWITAHFLNAAAQFRELGVF